MNMISLCRVVVLGFFVTFAAMPAQAFEPSKDVEVVVPSSAGGGSDLNARTIVDIIKSENFSPVNYIVNNKPGGAGAVALSYANTKAGDPNLLITIAIGQVIGSFALGWEIDASKMTPISIVADDDLFLCAVAGRFKDAADLLAQAKAGRLTFGGTHKANSDHLGFLLANKFAGTQFQYVSHGGSGEVLSSLLGKHIDVGIFNPSECLGQVQAGKVVPMLSFAAKRMDSDLFRNAPTFVEMGHPDVVTSESRVVLGPPNMPKDAVDYYVDLLRKVTDTPRWKNDYIKRNNLVAVFMDAEETQKHLDVIVQKRVPVFKDAGL